MENDATLNSEIYSHRLSLEHFAMKFTHNLEDAKDLVQDTIIKAIQYHKMYEQGTNLRGWLYTIMKNIFINGYRKAVRERAVFTASGDFYAFERTKSEANNRGK